MPTAVDALEQLGVAVKFKQVNLADKLRKRIDIATWMVGYHPTRQHGPASGNNEGGGQITS